jgi:hypothetical protein
MIQGSTPTHTFKLPFSTALIDAVRISYAQNGVLMLTKRKADCTMGEKSITVTLTQEETLAFDADSIVEIQVQVLTTGGDSLPSAIKRVSVDRLLDRTVLV